MSSSPEDVLNFLKKAHDEAVGLAEKIVFDKASASHRTAVALYSSIIELSGTCCSLVDNKNGAAIPIITRALLEAHVDLKNILQASRYGYYLELSYISEWLAILNEAQKGTNEYLSEIALVPDLDKTIQKLTAEKSKLNADGYKKLKMDQKFIRAGMEKEYRSIYNSLCAHAHNNIRALVDRHFEREQGDLSMVLYKDYSIGDHLIYIGMTAEILVRSTEAIHSKFETDSDVQIQYLRSEIDRIRGE